MAPQRRAPGDPPPQYGPMEERFSVEINHAGLFCGSGMNKTYFDGRVDHFDGCEVETWSPLWINHFVGQLGHDPSRVELYWLLPGKQLYDGLRIIQSDADTLMMTAVVPKFQYFQLYVDQKYLLDDISVIGSPTLPMVLSPQTESNVPICCVDAASPNSRRTCKVKAVKGNLQNCFSPCTKRNGGKDKDDSDDSDDGDSNYGDNLVDSDNEFDKDDDDLFAEWVDENYEDVKGKKKAENFDSDYDTDELDLPASDSDFTRSYNRLDWRKHMDDMQVLNQDAYKYLEAIEPSSWCRAFFTTLPKSDLLLNNTCEVFNKYMIDAREMPIRSMLQKIFNQLMTRYYTKNNEAEDMCGIICPKIRNKLDKQVEMAKICEPLPTGKGIFLVHGLTGKYTVDIHKDKCECGSWQLRGIPCRHAISCFGYERINPEDKVCLSYSIDAFKQEYGQIIMPCRDERSWQKINGIEVKPRQYEKHVGRPYKKRRKNPLEMEEGAKMSRHDTISHCSVCNSTEHNKRKCPNKGQQGQSLSADKRSQTQGGQKRKLKVKRNILTQESATTSVGQRKQHSQTTVLETLLQAQASQQSHVLRGPIPESTFIARNRDALQPTTATASTVGLKKKQKKRVTKASITEYK